MNLDGVIIGIATFFIIGIFHPLVIKGEYYFSKKIWPIFLIFGLAMLALSIFIQNSIIAAILGVTGISSLWGIKEIFEQETRVNKGWFPKNPKRKDYKDKE
ncbi:DUF4491 family protein [Treponema phagedenis]|uniref:DUF4491 family protein n=1 Tax=Treponema phagedenis TaxID=162 RepID=A0A0B7H0J9_TREPH|nr:DUF4491 family protein [Treponema phagedenis]EFW37977.1 hypothetical protein HMPREF9554_01515 [Treponema phagedenis F0421]NVP23424.1 DUF4491 family protein [Treponema phagedenis]QEJ95642.1 DUF4491 family protein [Treponema phagedenis]QEJ98566.1 DUF4491 family protein [Treponema phagedenis]QEK01497.1 DUF4491 family protein [Treponema phagedenis]